MTISTSLDETKTIIDVGGVPKMYISDDGTVEATGVLKATNSASANGEAVLYEQAFGVGQTLQNVTASRSVGTTYTNTTGKPIFVYVAAISTLASSGVITINGIPFYATTISQGGYAVGGQFAVPPGLTYSYNIDAGSPYITTWLEYR